VELKDALRSISNDARGWLKAWARDFSEAEASQPGDGGTAPNPLAWQLGHLACVEEDVASLFSEDSAPAPLVPAALRGVCATGAPSPNPQTRYLPLGELWTLLDRTHERLLAVIDAAEPADFDRPPRVKNPYFNSLGQGVYEAALHENYHVGEIAALRKVLGKPRIG
jgi:DinB family protein